MYSAGSVLLHRGGLRRLHDVVSQQQRLFKTRRRLPALPSTLNLGDARTGRAIAFTLGSTCTFYTAASIWEYETHRHDRRQQTARKLWPLDDYFQYNSGQKTGSFRQQVNEWWNRQSTAHRTFFGIFAANAVVLVMWRVPRLTPMMSKYFTQSPATGDALPILLSTFSHSSPVHFACNMFVLYSFSNAAVSLMGREQFVATYLSAGAISSLTSYLHKIAIAAPSASLGASGSIMAILGAVCTAIPESRLAIVFLPTLTFTAGSAIKAIVAFDILGVFLRWRFLDHVAHLGGTLFGIAYVLKGHILAQWWAAKVQTAWRQIRERNS